MIIATLIPIIDADGYVYVTDDHTEVVGGCIADYEPVVILEPRLLADLASEYHGAFVVAAREHPELWQIPAKTLEDLYDLLRAEDFRVLNAYGDFLANLPTFGGDDPATGTECVWSWDADRLLVGTCRDNLQIVSREDWW